MGVNTSGNVVMPVQPGQGTGLSFGALGADDSGRNVYGLQFTNTGSVTLDYGSGSGKNAYGASATVNNSTPILVNFTGLDRKSTRLNSSHYCASRMPSSS